MYSLSHKDYLHVGHLLDVFASNERQQVQDTEDVSAQLDVTTFDREVLAAIQQYWGEQGVESRPPIIDGKTIHLGQLFNIVNSKGGPEAVRSFYAFYSYCF